MGINIFRDRRMNDINEQSNNESASPPPGDFHLVSPIQMQTNPSETLSASDRDSDSDADRDIATILQFLIRSGQVRIIAAASPHIYEDDSDDQMRRERSHPKIDRHPDTSRLKNTDLSQVVKLHSGGFNDKHPNAPLSAMNPLPSLLKSREIGMNGRQKFSQGDRCQIIQRVLPNKKNEMDRYHGKVFCGTYTNDGNMFMSAAQDYCIRIYDTRNGQFKLKRLVEARDVGWSILDTAVSPDGCNFVYCSWSECIHICDIHGDPDLHEALPLYPDERRFCVFALRFSQDSREILGGANDECLYVFNREENKRTLKIKAHDDDVNTVAFADSTSQILFSGGDDGIVKVWDRRTLCEQRPKPVGILAGHEDGITYVDSKDDGRHLITNSKDQTIKLWDMRAFSPPNSADAVRRAAANHNWDYRWQRVPTTLNRPYKRRMPGDTSLMTYRGHSVLQTLIRCHFSPEFSTGQSYIYTGCAQGRVVIYDVLTGKIKKILRGHKGCVRDVSWHPYLNEVTSSSWDGSIVNWTYSRTELDSDTEDVSNFYDSSPENESTPGSSTGLRRSLRIAKQRRAQQAEHC